MDGGSLLEASSESWAEMVSVGRHRATYSRFVKPVSVLCVLFGRKSNAQAKSYEGFLF